MAGGSEGPGSHATEPNAKCVTSTRLHQVHTDPDVLNRNTLFPAVANPGQTICASVCPRRSVLDGPKTIVGMYISFLSMKHESSDVP